MLYNRLFLISLLVINFSNIFCYFKKLVLPNPLFISVKEIKENIKKYNLIDKKRYFCYPGFPMELETIFNKKMPALIEGVFPETFVLELEKAQVFGNNGYILIKQNNNTSKFLLDTIWDWEQTDNVVFKPNFIMPKIKKIKGRVAVIAQSGNNNYYHWMTEILPRLEILSRNQTSYDFIYVPKLEYKFQKDSLAALKIDMKMVIEADNNIAIEPDILIVPSVPSFSTVSPDWVISFLRKSFLSNNKYLEQIKFKAIFISRKNSSIRNFKNESELLEILKNIFDVKQIMLEDHSIFEQAAIFANANIIIAPHGAGLTNLIFAKPGTMVIEIFQYHLDETFWTLSQQLCLRHFCLLSLSPNEILKLKDTNFTNNDGRYANTVLDIEKIEEELNKLKHIFTSFLSAEQLYNMHKME